MDNFDLKKYLAEGKLSLRKPTTLKEGKGQDLADKYVAKLRQEFKNLSDDELDEFKKTLATAFDMNESVNEGAIQDVEARLTSAKRGAKASGGGYSGWVKTGRNSWKNKKTGRNAHSQALASQLGGFSDFKIKEGVVNGEKVDEDINDDELGEFKKTITKSLDLNESINEGDSNPMSNLLQTFEKAMTDKATYDQVVAELEGAPDHVKPKLMQMADEVIPEQKDGILELIDDLETGQIDPEDIDATETKEVLIQQFKEFVKVTDFAIATIKKHVNESVNEGITRADFYKQIEKEAFTAGWDSYEENANVEDAFNRFSAQQDAAQEEPKSYAAGGGSDFIDPMGLHEGHSLEGKDLNLLKSLKDQIDQGVLDSKKKDAFVALLTGLIDTNATSNDLEEGMSDEGIVKSIEDIRDSLESGESDGMPLDNETEALLYQELERLRDMLLKRGLSALDTY